jgi:RNA 2',3'-cyclic 3'-phosphodiesterase
MERAGLESAPRPDTARLFFALWPAPDVQRALETLAQALKRECGGRAIPGHNIHATLVFLGEVERARLPQLETLAATIALPRFELSVDHVQYWRHNHIVWAGVARCPDALQALVAQLSRELRVIGFTLDDRPHVPHITLVRDARQPPMEGRTSAVAWPVAEFALVESAPHEGRRVYEVLRRWPLGR